MVEETNKAFSEQVAAQAARKLKARAKGHDNVWFGFGMFGIIGWSVAIPTLGGALLGIWLDNRYPGTRSWTLALLVAGLIIGCWNAAYWVAKEEREMLEEEKTDD
jgi:ATP synthase protein I